MKFGDGYGENLNNTVSLKIILWQMEHSFIIVKYFRSAFRMKYHSCYLICCSHLVVKHREEHIWHSVDSFEVFVSYRKSTSYHCCSGDVLEK